MGASRAEENAQLERAQRRETAAYRELINAMNRKIKSKAYTQWYDV